MRMMTARIIIILQFFHQYFLFSLPAFVSNCEAPACSASAEKKERKLVIKTSGIGKACHKSCHTLQDADIIYGH